MVQRTDSDDDRLLIAAEEQLRADRAQLASIRRSLSKTEAILEQGAAAYKASRALLDSLPPGNSSNFLEENTFLGENAE